MDREAVFKYGSLEPRRPNVDKYAPIIPKRPLVIKYGPTEPKIEIPEIPWPKLKKELAEKALEDLKKQIKDCLEKFKAALEKKDIKDIVGEMGILLAELNLLYLKLNDLQKTNENDVQNVKIKPKRQILILYIVTAPIRKPKEDKK